MLTCWAWKLKFYNLSKNRNSLTFWEVKELDDKTDTAVVCCYMILSYSQQPLSSLIHYLAMRKIFFFFSFLPFIWHLHETSRGCEVATDLAVPLFQTVNQIAHLHLMIDNDNINWFSESCNVTDVPSRGWQEVTIPFWCAQMLLRLPRKSGKITVG